MNPFARLTPLPKGSTGERGFRAAQDARDHAMQRAQGGFAVLQFGPEFVWVSPIQAYTARAVACLAAGVRVIELVP